MSQSGEQLNHAIKKAWPASQHVPDVESRYLTLIQALVTHIGGTVTIEPQMFSDSVDFQVETDDLGNITLRTDKQRHGT